jgi:hypothetical protein
MDKPVGYLKADVYQSRALADRTVRSPFPLSLRPVNVNERARRSHVMRHSATGIVGPAPTHLPHPE